MDYNEYVLSMVNRFYPLCTILRKEADGRHNRAYVLDGDVPTLINTEYEDTTERLFDELETAGIAPKRLIITHGDLDHVSGFETVVERFDVETWCRNRRLPKSYRVR